MEKPHRLIRWHRLADAEDVSDAVAVEEPLEIRVNGRSVAVVMRTPGHDRELATGFLLTEGVLRRADDLLDLLVCRELPDGQAGNVVDALLRPEASVDFERLTRHVFSASSCGLCGKATLDAVFQSFAPVAAGGEFEPAILARLPEKLRAAQTSFGRTGGVHATGWFEVSGELQVLREDVGRHNAFDKVLGRALLDGRWPLAEGLLVVSGRLSFELVQKAIAAGAPVLAGIGAPTSLAIECAAKGNLTLVGFLREDRLNVYTAPERLGLSAPCEVEVVR